MRILLSGFHLPVVNWYWALTVPKAYESTACCIFNRLEATTSSVSEWLEPSTARYRC